MNVISVTLLGVVVAATLAAIACIALMFRRASRGRRGVLGVSAGLLASPAILLGLIVAPYYLDPRMLAYKRFYREIEVGMTRKEVLDLATMRYPVGGRRGFPTGMEDGPDQLGFFMNPERDREPNCDGIFLTLRNDVVLSKQYMAD